MLWLRQIGQWLVAMVLQVLLINQLQLGGVCHPFIYILPLLMMPITLPRWADMLIGAAVGLLMDVFCNSLGVHTAACIMLMYARRHLIPLWVNDIDRLTDVIGMQTMGVAPFIKYASILVVAHHLMVFFLTAWTLQLWWHTLLTILVSSIVSLVLILGCAALINKR
ncbi:MAG: rod shape-determining protein MreD [Paludibacteraceae bacterium]